MTQSGSILVAPANRFQYMVVAGLLRLRGTGSASVVAFLGVLWDFAPNKFPPPDFPALTHFRPTAPAPQFRGEGRVQGGHTDPSTSHSNLTLDVGNYLEPDP